MKRLGHFLEDFGRGLVFGYPLCCILRFCADPITFPSGVARGGKQRAAGSIYVPCGIFHKADWDMPAEPERVKWCR